MKCKYVFLQELPWKKVILDKGCYLFNGKKCFLWVKSSEKSSPALSAAHLPSASHLLVIAPIYCTNNWVSTIFYDVMINYTQTYYEKMQYILVNLVSDTNFHSEKTKLQTNLVWQGPQQKLRNEVLLGL